MIEIRDVTHDKKGMKDFINIQYTLYKDDPNFVPPLRLERSSFFNLKKNPFFDHGQVAFFVAYRDGKPVGRITAHHDDNYDAWYHTKQGFFGFFECEENHETAKALIKAAENWNVQHGLSCVMGPMNFSTNQESPGFLIKGFDMPPNLMMPYTKKWYPGFFASQGYKKAQNLYAYRLIINPMPTIVQRMGARLEKKYGDKVKIRQIQKKHAKRDLDIVIKIFNDAWSSNWGYIPLTDREMDNMRQELQLIADPHQMFLLYYNDEPVAFYIAIPNLNELLIKIKDGKLSLSAVYAFLFKKKEIKWFRLLLMGVLRKYRHLGFDMMLYYRAFCEARDFTNYQFVEPSWILESNETMNTILAKLGAERYKEYMVMEKKGLGL